MRTLSTILLAATFGLLGCGPSEFSKEEAFTILKKKGGYPHACEYTIHCGSPHQAKIITELGMVKSGLVTIKEGSSGALGMGEPLIRFQDKANPYLINGSPDQFAEDFTYNFQRVKIADEDITEITSVVTDKRNKTASVQYTIVYSNLTPFSALLKRNLKKPQTGNIATFLYSDEYGWLLKKQP